MPYLQKMVIHTIKILRQILQEFKQMFDHLVDNKHYMVKSNSTNEMRCTVWYHLYNLKNIKKHSWRNAIVSSASLKLEGFLFLKFGQRGGSQKIAQK